MKITREDWSHLLTQLQQEDRERLGDPPTYEEAEALLAGELPAEEAERVRRLLIAYPDLIRAVVNEFPEGDAKPGDPGYVSGEEVARRFSKLLAAIGGAR